MLHIDFRERGTFCSIVIYFCIFTDSVAMGQENVLFVCHCTETFFFFADFGLSKCLYSSAVSTSLLKLNAPYHTAPRFIISHSVHHYDPYQATEHSRLTDIGLFLHKAILHILPDWCLLVPSVNPYVLRSQSTLR